LIVHPKVNNETLKNGRVKEYIPYSRP
jgi:hypothetical protein